MVEFWQTLQLILLETDLESPLSANTQGVVFDKTEAKLSAGHCGQASTHLHSWENKSDLKAEEGNWFRAIDWE